MRTFTSCLPAAIAALVVVGSFAGCAEVVFHAAGSNSYPANPHDCRIRLLAGDPGSDFEEIGLLAVEGDPRVFNDPDVFIAQAQEQVCRAGGDAVVTQVNGLGSIVRGVVFRRRKPRRAAEEPNTECNPICSPGFSCKKARCVPLCNPACEPKEFCGRDRVCHPATDTIED
jgi:hypothetical protein